MRCGWVPGCPVAIAQNGLILHTRGYGMANLEHCPLYSCGIIAAK